MPLALEAWSLNHWTTKEVPNSFRLYSRLGPTLFLDKSRFIIEDLSYDCVYNKLSSIQFSSVPSLSRVRLCNSITNSWNLLKLMSVESVMSSNHLILCYPLLLLPSIFPSLRIFSNESAFCIRWPKYSASTSVLPMDFQD